MSAKCEYGEFLDQALHKKFIAGLKSKGLQRQLLSEEKLALAQALQKAKAFEATEMNSKALKYPEPMTVKKLAPASPCFHSGKSNHLPEECRFWNATCHRCHATCHRCHATCHSCGRTGHISPFASPKHSYPAKLSVATKGSEGRKQQQRPSGWRLPPRELVTLTNFDLTDPCSWCKIITGSLLIFIRQTEILPMSHN